MQNLEKQNDDEGALLYHSRMVNGEMSIEPNLALLDRRHDYGHVDSGGVPWSWSVGPVPLITESTEAIPVDSLF
jgi:hypothetical protein